MIIDQYPALHNKAFGAPNMSLVNKALFQALKSGGVLIISGALAPEPVKQEVVAAGFILESESNLRDKKDSVNHFLLQFRRD